MSTRVRSFAYLAGVLLVAAGSFEIGQLRATTPAAAAASRSDDATSSAPVVTSQTIVLSPPASGIDPDMLRDAVRTAVRAELDARDEQRHPEPPPEEAAKATATGRALVASAIASKRWTDKDASELRMALRSMDTEGRSEVLRTLLPAINRDELRVEAQGLVF